MIAMTSPVPSLAHEGTSLRRAASSKPTSMPTLIVANSPKDWPFDIPGVDVVDAWDYLTSPKYSDLRGAKVLNLCRSYSYQSTGYYVSLLAEARNHKPLPSIQTLQDLRSQSLVRLVSDDLDELMQQSLQNEKTDDFELSIYFGRNSEKQYDRLSLQLFNLFQSPLLRVKFSKLKKWQIRSVKAISGSDVPEVDRPFVAEAALKHFSGRAVSRPRKSRTRYDMAILWNPEEKENAPSNEAALKKFVKAGANMGIECELITKDDYGRLLEFDSLFIRETTSINDHTYRFARKAASEGMVVMDDPQSIARCTNKVFLAELLERHGLPTPKTVVLHEDNVDDAIHQLGFPIVIKKPDSSFSRGVVKINTAEELHARLPEFFEESELLVAQEFMLTDFDWRISMIDRRPLFACKYHMAPGHWQVIQQEKHGDDRFGGFDTMAVEMAPRKAVNIAMKAANLIGDGLYGVDIKQSGGNFHIIEINDNPNIDAGVEDEVLRDDLYHRVMSVFLTRLERIKAWGSAEL
jgi:glutathione synthase/RimK-type ligase-like ATP-grasp enzyme